MTTMKSSKAEYQLWCRTYDRSSSLKIQFADVARALAGARIWRGVISAGYSQDIPSQPIAKKVLKTKRKTAAPTPRPLLSGRLVKPARKHMLMHMPAEPTSMSGRRPTRSTRKIGMKDARKYCEGISIL